MIKILLEHSFPCETTRAYINLCNAFNAENMECQLYAPGYWHLDKCNGKNSTEFYPLKGDVIIFHSLRIKYYIDLFNAHNVLIETHPLKWYKKWYNILLKVLKSYIYRVFFSRKCVLSIQTEKEWNVVKSNQFLPGYKFKLHLAGFFDSRDKAHIPNVQSSITPSRLQKSFKVAGVLSDISRENNIELAIQKALSDNCEIIILFSFLKDPIYYYKTIQPMFQQYPGRILYAGYVDDRQSIYDQVTDVYDESPQAESNGIEYECLQAEVNYHGKPHVQTEEIKNCIKKWTHLLDI